MSMRLKAISPDFDQSPARATVYFTRCQCLCLPFYPLSVSVSAVLSANNNNNNNNVY